METKQQLKQYIRLISLMEKASKAKGAYTVIKALYKVYYMTLKEVANNNITSMQADGIVLVITDRIAKLSKGLSTLRIKALEDLARIEVDDEATKPVKPVVVKPVVVQPTVTQQAAPVTRVHAPHGHRSENFRFDMVGIKSGEVLQWTDDPTVTVTVVGNNKVFYKGRKWSMSTLDKVLSGVRNGRQGPLYFTYRGKTLVQLRAEAGY